MLELSARLNIPLAFEEGICELKASVSIVV